MTTSLAGRLRKACAFVLGALLCVAAQPPPPLEAVDGVLRAAGGAGQQVDIKGANWFGFNVESGMVDGLWAGIDLATTTAQLRLLGFNALRLPFDFSLLPQPAKDYKWANCERRDVLRNTMDPDASQGRKATLPPQRPASMPPMPALVPPGMCNSYVPSTGSREDALIWLTMFLVEQGFYVVLNHHSLVSGAHPQLNPSNFARMWGNLWTRIAALPTFGSRLQGRVFVDIDNEPDHMGVRWSAQPGKVGATDIYLRVMDRLHAITPTGMLYWIEGTGQTNYGLSWGSGFVTDASIVARYNIDDASPFFTALLKKPYVNQVVVSPHEYGPLIRKSNIVGEALFERLDKGHGYLMNQGFCAAGTCQRFPVVVGEWGSSHDPVELPFLHDFAAWMRSQKSNSWMVWAVNANSGDTGGLVQPTLWQDLRWDKLRYMIKDLGLMPWWRQQQG